MNDINSEISFEDGFSRLEEILEKLNTGGISLDESLQLYEKAEDLIVKCEKKLLAAEKKVEMLIKQRNGELSIDSQGNPQSKPFSN